MKTFQVYDFHIYPKELELKVEYQDDHATFLNLDITINDGIFIYNLFDKKKSFPFSVERDYHVASNIPQSFFFSNQR